MDETDEGVEYFREAYRRDHEDGDPAAAVPLYERAWALGYTDAAHNLGGLHRRGGDLETAEKWYARGAETGDASAMYELGRIHEDRGEDDLAERLFRRSAEGGLADGAYAVANYLDERGDDPEEYLRLLRVAAEGGNHRAMNDLGVELIAQGENDEGELWYRRSTDEGNVTARHNLGCVLEAQGRIAAARRLFEQAWNEEGDAHAAFHVGLGYIREDDRDAAREWYLRAAEAGDPGAMSRLGSMARNDDDHAEADRWWRRAAEHDDSDAIRSLGLAADEAGREDEAEAWYRRAAEEESLCAYNLGTMLARRQAFDEAERWLERAQELGDEDAEDALRRVRAERDG